MHEKLRCGIRIYTIGNVRMSWHCGTFVKPLLHYERNNARVTVNNTKILSAAQQYYGEFMSPVTIKTYLGLRVKCPTFLSHFNHILIFSTDFHWSLISNFTGIRPVRAALIHTKRRAEEDDKLADIWRATCSLKTWYQPTAITT